MPAETRPAPKPADYVLERYGTAIDYYWKASRSNRLAFKLTRYATVVLGAVVTLVASVSAVIEASSPLKPWFTVLTPVLAATLAIIGGLAQSFQWGAAWSKMVIAAEQLERERDRILVTSPDRIDPVKELETLNEVLLAETHSFFERIMAPGEQPAKADNRGETH